ncbi:hypothetical protein BC374_17795 [Ensifer sp. LC13]|nr:hypothetical protein BC362_10170 [Ensifer sp. LC14]OCP10924.1 hypothetical protein BC374_17795 [Ensifer sp. LC13]OCP11531.1 hypothetical protein BBX50_18060 [Ensifer sp. LC11]OCP33349.1 hypothetical protein BC364_16950 [Ensifer sp. LC499]
MSAADLLIMCGEEIHGAGWKRPLADRLGVSVRTLSRWAAKTTSLGYDHGLWADLREIIAEEIHDTLDRVKSMQVLEQRIKIHAEGETADAK